MHFGLIFNAEFSEVDMMLESDNRRRLGDCCWRRGGDGSAGGAAISVWV